MRRLLILGTGIAAATIVFVASALPAAGADSGSVPVRIQVAAPCVIIGPSTGLDFPPLPFSASAGSASTDSATPDISLENCSGTAETVYARGSNATGASSGAVWTLTGSFSPSNNLYNLALRSSAGGTFLDLDPVDRLWRSMPAGATDTIRADIWMPTVGSDGAGDTMSMQITFTATF